MKQKVSKEAEKTKTLQTKLKETKEKLKDKFRSWRNRHPEDPLTEEYAKAVKKGDTAALEKAIENYARKFGDGKVGKGR